MNTFGKLFTLTTFGESHGAAVGGVVDGMPAGIPVDTAFIQHELDRRRPGQSRITTDRREADRVELLSGVFEGKSTGAPIGFLVRNTNQHSKDYDDIRNLFRPSHADYTYYSKYGIRDHRGGGRASARITLSRVVAGALAKLVLRQLDISITAYTSQVGDIQLDRDCRRYDLSRIESNSVRCPDPGKAKEMEALIAQVKQEGDTIGGVVTCVVKGCPAGLGEPESGKLHALLGAAMLSINAAKGFEYGEGFAGAAWRGSQQNDIFLPAKEKPQTSNLKPQTSNLKPQTSNLKLQTNHSGGIQGGISNGEDIYFRVAFKPVATLLMAQQTVDKAGHPVTMNVRGRHDPCVLPRAVPVVEAMAAMTILDALLISRTNRL